MSEISQVGFQIDACLIGLLANQFHAERVSANHRASSEHQFENQSQHYSTHLSTERIISLQPTTLN